MKTILEWLEELPQPYRDEAIANYDEEVAEESVGVDKIVDRLAEAIDCAFEWSKSSQGFSYWNDLWAMYR